MPEKGMVGYICAGYEKNKEMILHDRDHRLTNEKVKLTVQ